MTKQPARKKAVTTKKSNAVVKIIHTSKCQTISKKSTLTYNISKDVKDKIYIRINNNTGGRYFSNEWISLDNITDVISIASDDSPVTSNALFPLFKGKSVNTPSFLLAALIKEGLLSPCPGKHRHYVFASTEKLLKIVDKSD